MSSWVKVSRKLLTSAIASKPEYLAVWMHLILSASYKPGEVLVGHQVVKLNAGQLVFGRIKFAQQIGVSEHTLRMALKSLETLQQITIKSESKFSVITITNWSKYQTDSPADHQQATSKPPASHHNKEVLEIQEEDQKHLSSAEAEDAQPKKPRKKKSSEGIVAIEQLVLEGCDPDHARDWLVVRAKAKAALTPTAWAAMHREAAKAGISIGQAVQISAERSWRGFKSDWDWRSSNVTATNGQRGGTGRLSAVDQVRAENDAAEARRRAARPTVEEAAKLQEPGMDGGSWDRDFARIRDIDGKIVGDDGRAVRAQVDIVLRNE